MSGFAFGYAGTNSAPDPEGCGPNLVEAVGIDTAGQRRNVNADGSQSEPTCENAPMARRTIGKT
jgi:hypothetical protein